MDLKLREFLFTAKYKITRKENTRNNPLVNLTHTESAEKSEAKKPERKVDVR